MKTRHLLVLCLAATASLIGCNKKADLYLKHTEITEGEQSYSFVPCEPTSSSGFTQHYYVALINARNAGKKMCEVAHDAFVLKKSDGAKVSGDYYVDKPVWTDDKFVYSQHSAVVQTIYAGESDVELYVGFKKEELEELEKYDLYYNNVKLVLNQDTQIK